MKKTILVAIASICLLAACGKKENTHVHPDGSTHANHESPAKDTIQTEFAADTTTALSDQEARTQDSLRQVKEHGHAH